MSSPEGQSTFTPAEEVTFVLCGAAVQSGGGRFLDALPPALRAQPVAELKRMLNAAAPNDLTRFLRGWAADRLAAVPVAEALAMDPKRDVILSAVTGHAAPLLAFRVTPPAKAERELAAAAAEAAAAAAGDGGAVPNVPGGTPGVARGYHGSAAQKWLSILGTGLRNFNGKDSWATTRSAFGEGIYAASTLAVATDYASTHTTAFLGPQAFFDYQSSLFVAAVDIALTPAVARKEVAARSEYFVIQAEAHVCVRYLLVLGRPASPTRALPPSPSPVRGSAAAAAPASPTTPVVAPAPASPVGKRAQQPWWVPLLDWAVIAAVAAILWWLLRLRHGSAKAA